MCIFGPLLLRGGAALAAGTAQLASTAARRIGRAFNRWGCISLALCRGAVAACGSIVARLVRGIALS
eukprot:1802153-Alexandrium_andersonii.AAC.1